MRRTRACFLNVSSLFPVSLFVVVFCARQVGIGIEGLEGKQAVMASDVSIGQFRFLNRLLLLHGGWSYRRLSTLILYCFYKNITVALVRYS